MKWLSERKRKMAEDPLRYCFGIDQDSVVENLALVAVVLAVTWGFLFIGIAFGP